VAMGCALLGNVVLGIVVFNVFIIRIKVNLFWRKSIVVKWCWSIEVLSVTEMRF
jgi:hypothetical protein